MNGEKDQEKNKPAKDKSPVDNRPAQPSANGHGSSGGDKGDEGEGNPDTGE